LRKKKYAKEKTGLLRRRLLAMTTYVDTIVIARGFIPKQSRLFLLLCVSATETS
jgi:hypothetical protein